MNCIPVDHNIRIHTVIYRSPGRTQEGVGCGLMEWASSPVYGIWDLFCWGKCICDPMWITFPPSDECLQSLNEQKQQIKCVVSIYN